MPFKVSRGGSRCIHVYISCFGPAASLLDCAGNPNQHGTHPKRVRLRLLRPTPLECAINAVARTVLRSVKSHDSSSRSLCLLQAANLHITVLQNLKKGRVWQRASHTRRILTMAQSALSAVASLCVAPSTAALPLAGASVKARRHSTKRTPYSLHVRASTNPSSSSPSSSSASAPASAACHPLARSLTAAAAAALVLLPSAALVLPQPAVALSERERYEQLDSNFLSSPILKQLLKQSEENREKNRQEIENKYCLRGAEWGVGDCALGDDISAEEKKDYLEALREIVTKQAAE
ncbi:unnamed protein product [Closterium sp. Yama58-4]|nr:unnamed protein product [Closterium sp. Yama58-4]